MIKNITKGECIKCDNENAKHSIDDCGIVQILECDECHCTIIAPTINWAEA